MTVMQVKLSCSLDKSAMVINFVQLPRSKGYPTALNSFGMTPSNFRQRWQLLNLEC